MSLYPSLEDMQVHKIAEAQDAWINQSTQSFYPQLGEAKPVGPTAPQYPWDNYMGLELTPDVIALNIPKYMQVQSTAAVTTSTSGSMVAPLSNQTAGLRHAQVTNGVREVVVCKGVDKRIGLRVKDISNGVFITLVCKDSPAAMVGLRFGDQILQINGTDVAGFSKDKVHKILKNLGANDISIVVRDRPLERTVTMHKDSNGRVGFEFKSGKIMTIVKDSSAARNGLLIDHQLLEINGQNVVGMKDKEVREIISNINEPVITVTIIPSFIFDHMMKNMSMSFLQGIMDHSTPNDTF